MHFKVCITYALVGGFSITGVLRACIRLLYIFQCANETCGSSYGSCIAEGIMASFITSHLTLCTPV